MTAEIRAEPCVDEIVPLHVALVRTLFLHRILF